MLQKFGEPCTRIDSLECIHRVEAGISSLIRQTADQLPLEQESISQAS